MKKQNFLSRAIAAVAIMLIWAGGASVDAQQLNPAIYGPQVNTIPKDATEYVPNEVIVKFKDASGVEVKCTSKRKIKTTSVQSLDDKLASLGISEAEQLMPLTGAKKLRQNKAPLKSLSGREVVEPDMSRLYLMNVDSTKNISVYEVIEQLESMDEVEYAEPNYRVYAMATDNSATYTAEPLYSQQWGLEAINMPALWDVPKVNDKRPVIAIIDTGVDTEHPDLKDNLWVNEAELNGEDYIDDDNNGFADDVYGWDFIKNHPLESDPNGHGTHCAGIAAAVGNNGIGITGANPDALIMPVTVLGADGTGDIATLARGIDYAVANGADVISMSLGSLGSSMSLYDTCKKAFQSAYLIAAAGNSGSDIYCKNPSVPGRQYPAAYDVVLGVMASDSDGNRAGFSNYDPDGPYFTDYDEDGDNFYNYEVYAPGVDIMSTYPGGQYKSLNGTSMATPLVAGALSRLIQVKEDRYKGTTIGDIVHSSEQDINVLDIMKVYNFNDENRETEVIIQRVEFDDTAMGDGDGLVESGEIIDIYPTARCMWGEASNIKLSVSTDSEYEKEIAIEIIENNVDLGYNLSSLTWAKSKNPIRVKIHDNLPSGWNLRLLFTAGADELVAPVNKQIEKVVYSSADLGGVITKDMTLYADKEYIVSRNLVVPEGVTLTIKPGTVLKFMEGTSFVNAGGIINCVGNQDSLINLRPYRYNYNSKPHTYDLLGFELKYCKIENVYLPLSCVMSDCIINQNSYLPALQGVCTLIRTNVDYTTCPYTGQGYISFADNCNIKVWPAGEWAVSNIDDDYRLDNSNIISSEFNAIINIDGHAGIYYDETPNYYGSAREDIVRRYIYDLNHPTTPTGYGVFDLSNMLTRPNAEAHGIVWKVVVNGYDAQDEFELLPPLGIGKHKFEVYFNRPMNKAVKPTVAMGAEMPYNQIGIDEDGSWNEEGTIYTVYLTIDGKTGADGTNRIYVADAKDDENFEILVEDTRFNVMVQSAGSLATHFFAEAGLGKVTLTWETDEEDFEDLLGYNILRYTEHVDSIYETDIDKYGDWDQHLIIKGDTTLINATLIDSRDQSFTDYNVVPGTTYYYQIKQMTTSLTSHDLSNVVSATPLTASKGDANGSMSVDVADVVTEVAYMTYQDPQPFIFEAADVITDSVINVLDVVGTVNIIKTPVGAMAMSVDNSAIYTIEDGILYVESYIPLGGVQFRFNVGEYDEIIPLEALDGFETVSDDQGDNGYLFFAFSMSGKVLPIGKQALLQIGNAEITEVVLSDATGKNVVAIDGMATGLGTIEAMQMVLPYPNPFDEVLTIPYKIGKEGRHEVKIVVSTIAGSRVAEHNVSAEYGEYSWNWYAGESVQAGVYFVSLYVDDKLMQTAKVVKK